MIMIMMMILSCMLRNMRNENDLLLEARQAVYVENIEAYYEDIEKLNNLDVTHIFCCQKHVKNCALQNIFKIYNWWHQRHQK